MSISATPDKPRSQYKVGVFDSGVGGLTVLKEIRRQLPNESVIYFGDTARVPYGNRSKSDLLRFGREIVAWMIDQQVKMIITACNTSSALVLEEIRSEFSVPILGIILPGARAAVKSGRRIGVISTEATAKSNAYHQAVQEIDATTKVWQVACQEFVPLVEGNRIHDPYTLSAAKRYIMPLVEQGIDTLVYGCTHYPHLAPIFKQFVPQHITLVDPAEHLTFAAARELEILGLSNSEIGLETDRSQTEFFVSGDPEQFAEISQQWLGYRPDVRHVSVEILESVHAAAHRVDR